MEDTARAIGAESTYSFPTLPDLLRPDLPLLFVGINPSLYAVERGHYFARGSNRFWPALSRSKLSAPIRASLGREILRPEDDLVLPDFGIGFTDVVKRPSRNAAGLSPADYLAWIPRLVDRLKTARPRVACFQGVTGYRVFLREALAELSPVESPPTNVELGRQPQRLGTTRLFVVPSPSGANARYRLEDQIAWFDRLAEYLEEV